MSEIGRQPRVGEPSYGVSESDRNKKPKVKEKYLSKSPDWSRFMHPSKIPIKPKEGKPLEFTEPDKKLTKKGK